MAALDDLLLFLGNIDPSEQALNQVGLFTDISLLGINAQLNSTIEESLSNRTLTNAAALKANEEEEQIVNEAAALATGGFAFLSEEQIKKQHDRFINRQALDPTDNVEVARLRARLEKLNNKNSKQALEIQKLIDGKQSAARTAEKVGATMFGKGESETIASLGGAAKFDRGTPLTIDDLGGAKGFKKGDPLTIKDLGGAKGFERGKPLTIGDLGGEGSFFGKGDSLTIKDLGGEQKFTRGTPFTLDDARKARAEEGIGPTGKAIRGTPFELKDLTRRQRGRLLSDRIMRKIPFGKKTVITSLVAAMLAGAVVVQQSSEAALEGPAIILRDIQSALTFSTDPAATLKLLALQQEVLNSPVHEGTREFAKTIAQYDPAVWATFKGVFDSREQSLEQREELNNILQEASGTTASGIPTGIAGGVGTGGRGASGTGDVVGDALLRQQVTDQGFRDRAGNFLKSSFDPNDPDARSASVATNELDQLREALKQAEGTNTQIKLNQQTKNLLALDAQAQEQGDKQAPATITIPEDEPIAGTRFQTTPDGQTQAAQDTTLTGTFKRNPNQMSAEEIRRRLIEIAEGKK